MAALRIIPRLDVKGNNLVKGVHLEGLRVLGLPELFARSYYLAGADELLYMDVVASLYGRNNLEDVIRRTATSIFIPITAGGGVRSVEDARKLLRAGADKIAINTAATKDPELITRVAEVFGSQCMVLAVEAIESEPGRWMAYTDNGREPTGRDVVEWCQEAVERGAGEILLTSVDREGTGKGFDLELVQSVSRVVSVPVIAHGGAGSRAHIEELLSSTSVGAISCASIFHYHVVEELGVQKREEGNVDYLKQFLRGGDGRGLSVLEIFDTTSISELKQGLAAVAPKSVKAGHCCIDDSPPPEVLGVSKAPSLARSAQRVGIPEYGRGNLFSVEQALRHVGADVVVTADPEVLSGCDKIVLAGVGSFKDGMRQLRELGLDEVIREMSVEGVPILGICLGMQLLFEEGLEFGSTKGLGLFPGVVAQLAPGANGESVRIPHIGWNDVRPRAGGSNGFTHRLLAGLEAGAVFYFVHSFMVPSVERDFEAGVSAYGPNTFCSIAVSENLAGCQFHPERSGAQGLKIYENWVNS